MKSVLTSFVFLFWAITIQAQVIHIPADHSSIQVGIDAAVDGDTVLVEEGTYAENIDFKGKSITVASQFLMDGDTSHISGTIIDGSSPAQADIASVVIMRSGEDTTSVLCGFTITGGSGTRIFNESLDIWKSGGGIFISGSGAGILHNIIRDNVIKSDNDSTVIGGGIFIEAASSEVSVIIRDNCIRNNSVESVHEAAGAGICFGTTGNVMIDGNSIHHNRAETTGDRESAHGGGILLGLGLPTEGNIIVRNNLIYDNQVTGIGAQGGAVDIIYYEPGGIFTDPHPCPEIYNNIIHHNKAVGTGEGVNIGGAFRILTGLFNHDAGSGISPQPVIINNTVVANSASLGCGLANWNSFPVLFNNIFWNDLSAAGSQELISGSDTIATHNLHALFNNVQGGWGSPDMNNIDQDPLLAPDYQLSSGSPCISRGVESIEVEGVLYSAPSYDHLGIERPDPALHDFDLGAFEYIPPEQIHLPDASNRKIRIFPNPVNDRAFIRTTDGRQISEVSIIDLTGRIILKKGMINHQETAIGPLHLTPGIYLFRIVTDESVTEKIIIK